MEFTEGVLFDDIAEDEWAFLDRTEKSVHTDEEYVVTDTPLLVNIKGDFKIFNGGWAVLEILD